MVPSCLQAISGGFTHAANLHHLVGALAYAKLATSQTASRSISFGFAVDRLLDVKRQQRQLAPRSRSGIAVLDIAPQQYHDTHE